MTFHGRDARLFVGGVEVGLASGIRVEIMPMTEQEWLSSNDPAAMLRLVSENPDHQNINCRSTVRGGKKGNSASRAMGQAGLPFASHAIAGAGCWTCC